MAETKKEKHDTIIPEVDDDDEEFDEKILRNDEHE